MPEDTSHASADGWNVESIVGSRVLLGAGLISLLAAAVIFVKVANDHQWIPPELRVAGGLIAGLALLLGGTWWLGKGRTLVAEGITGLGASVVYLSLWGAFGPFHLIDARVAFAAMIAVSASLALIAWRRASQNVALAGLVGGALTPALLVAGQFDRTVLAVYLAVLCAAMLVLAVGARHRYVEAAAFAAALFYAPAFVPSSIPGEVWTSTQNLIVASVLFAEFALALFVAARREGKADAARLALLVGEVVAYATVLELQLGWNEHALALADAGLAAVLFAAVAGSVPPALRTAYGWLGLGVLTRAVEAWGGVHALTALGAVEGAGMVYAGIRYGHDWMRTCGYVVLLAAVGGAILHLAVDAPAHAVFNTRTFAVGAVVLALLAAIRELRAAGPALPPGERDLGTVATVFAVGLAVAGATLDTVTATAGTGAWTEATQTVISALWSVAAAALVALGFQFRFALLRWLGIGLFAAAIIKVFAVDLSAFDPTARVLSALVLGALLVIVAGAYQFVMLRGRRVSGPAPEGNP